MAQTLLRNPLAPATILERYLCTKRLLRYQIRRAFSGLPVRSCWFPVCSFRVRLPKHKQERPPIPKYGPWYFRTPRGTPASTMGTRALLLQSPRKPKWDLEAPWYSKIPRGTTGPTTETQALLAFPCRYRSAGLRNGPSFQPTPQSRPAQARISVTRRNPSVSTFIGEVRTPEPGTSCSAVGPPRPSWMSSRPLVRFSLSPWVAAKPRPP